MESHNPYPASYKSALFVDFDNIFIGLSKTDPDAAERFASDPPRWLSWLEKGFPTRSPVGSQPACQRSILVRRCYPNPDAGFRRFRSFFTSAAFSVIDCPTLTRTGKNSSDIYMVMDILDMLEHKTHFDEFIIFSGDSDFMPVLLRLRAHDRRTTTLAIDFMPPAFKAACDLVISEEEFIEEALGITHEGTNGTLMQRAQVPMPLLREMAAQVYASASEEREIDGAGLPEILKGFREFRDSTNWLGFGTSQRLAEALAGCEPGLQIVRVNPMMYKIVLRPQPARVGKAPVKTGPASLKYVPAQPRPALTPVKPGPEPTGDRQPARRAERSQVAEKPLEGEKQIKSDQSQLREVILAEVRQVMAGAAGPMVLARVSQHIVTRLGPQVFESQWAGAGSFKRLLLSYENLGFEIATQPEPGYLFDPERHARPGAADTMATLLEEEAPSHVIEEKTARGKRSKAKAAKAGEIGTASDAPSVAIEPMLQDEPTMGAGSVVSEQPLIEVGSEAPLNLPGIAEFLPPLPFEDQERGENAYTGDYEPEVTDAQPGVTYEESLPTLEEFIRRVSRVTGAPDLSPERYALVFRGILNELQEIAAGEKRYNTYQSSKAVSEYCAGHGEQVARSDVVLVFKGIIFQDGTRFSSQPGSYTGRQLAEIVRDNIIALCQRAQLELTEYEERLLDDWILGGLDGSFYDQVNAIEG